MFHYSGVRINIFKTLKALELCASIWVDNYHVGLNSIGTIIHNFIINLNDSEKKSLQ